MKGFIVYSTYRLSEERDKAFIYLFGRLENGESFLTISEYKPYFFIKTTDRAEAEKLVKAEFEDTQYKNFKDDVLTKVTFKVPTEIKENRDFLENKKIKTFESDVLFVNRFLIDHEITAAMDIEGDFKKGQFVNRIYETPKLKAVEFLPKLKVLSIDLETSMKGELYSCSLYDGTYEKVFLVSDKQVNNAVSFGNERSLLEALKNKIIELDPDMIVGWNVIDFDLNYLKQAFERNKIPFTLGRTDWPSKLRIETSFFIDSKADIPGRIVLDGIHVLKSSVIRQIIKVPDYKLDTVAEVILGDKKLIGHENKGTQIEEAYKHDQQKLVDYNLLDSKLVYRILEKKDLITLTMLRSLLTGMSMDRVSASVASLDSIYLRMLKKHGIVANYSGSVADTEERIKGGFVMASTPGIYDNIIVCDFKSLYPSLMRTFNIDPYSFVPNPPKGDLNKDEYIRCANGAVFRNSQGFLPQILQRIWEQRDIAKKRKDATAIHALKILMNSMFGALANPSCRYYSLEMANAITHTGQMMIKLVANEVEKRGFKVIYGDTDSIFIQSSAKTVEEAEKYGKEIAGEVNAFIQNYIKEEYRRESFLELQFEKVYKKFMMPKLRGSEGGSKKRYAGLIVKDGEEEIDVTGLEFVRGDWCDAAKDFQYKILDLIFHEKDSQIKKFIKDYVDAIKAGKMDDKLVLRKAIRKELIEYTKTTPPHVKAARKLPSINSNIIEYYIADDNEPYPAEMMKGRKINYDYYLEKQIEPIADTILSFYGMTFTDLIKGHTQKGLDGFF